jgi:hypothetical protein
VAVIRPTSARCPTVEVACRPIAGVLPVMEAKPVRARGLLPAGGMEAAVEPAGVRGMEAGDNLSGP